MNSPNTLKEITPRERKLALVIKAIEEFSDFERSVFFLFLTITLVSGLIMTLNLSRSLMVEIPSSGGTITEGIVGTPRFINPLIPLSDADRDIVNLVYSGLLKSTERGNLIPDIADHYTISPDGKIFDFVIREDAVFHDNTPITADDIVFTIERAQDPLLKSTKRANWEGVTVEKISEREVKFTLKQAYAPFIENMTLGILPKHIWKETDAETFSFSQYNIEPVGSGPYKVESVKTNQSKVPIIYNLVPFKKYTFGKPFINRLILRFYKNDTALLDAFERGEVDNVSTVSPDYAKKLKTNNARVETTTLPRVFGLFFNQNQAPVFTQSEVRQALNVSAPREIIVREVLNGYGNIIDGPIPPGLLPLSNSTSTPKTSQSTSTPIESAKKILAKNGWTLNEKDKVLEKKTKKQNFKLEFSISTGNAPDLKKTAEILKSEWEKLGAKVEVKTFDMGDLNQSVIRPRKYDSLLFGEIVGRDLDLFAFWHSSQRNDPGINIALYANTKADKLLEEVRTITNFDDRMKKYLVFEQEIDKDTPAVFLYSPDFIYIISNKIKGFSVTHATVPSERFENVYAWHTETDTVWKIFARNIITKN